MYKRKQRTKKAKINKNYSVKRAYTQFHARAKKSKSYI